MRGLIPAFAALGVSAGTLMTFEAPRHFVLIA